MSPFTLPVFLHTPVFFKRRFDSLFAGLLITTGCCVSTESPQQTHTQDSTSQDSVDSFNPDWPTGWEEELNPVSCSAKRCFVVEPATTLCSLDPPVIPDSDFFRIKSQITLTEGAYPLHDTEIIPDFSVEIASPSGRTTVTAIGGLHYEIRPYEGILELYDETFKSRRPSPFSSDDLHLNHLILVTRYFNFLKDGHFRMGNPNDIRWWLQAHRGVVAKVDGNFPTSLFRASPGEELEIWYMPCRFEGMPDDHFQFELANGDHADLLVRSHTNQGGTGYYVGRLLRATGSYRGHEFDIQDATRLAFYTRDDSAVRMIRPMALQFAEPIPSSHQTSPKSASETPLKEQTCGLILSPGSSDEEDEPWIGHEITCALTRGAEIEVLKVHYPEDRYRHPN